MRKTISEMMYNATVKPISISGSSPIELDWQPGALLTHLHKRGLPTIMAADAYGSKPIRPPRIGYSIIEDMDDVVIRQWDKTTGEWRDVWFRATFMSYLRAVGVLAYSGGYAGISPILSPREAVITCGHKLRWEKLFQKYYVTCEWDSGRRPYGVASLTSATIVQIRHRGNIIAWFAIIGPNHLPMILQHARCADYSEPEAIRQWRTRQGLRTVPEISVVHVYRDVRLYPSICKLTAFRGIRENGRTNIIQIDETIGKAALAEHDLARNTMTTFNTVFHIPTSA